MHQWKGRLQSETEGYPFENGPPFSVGGQGKYPPEAGGQGPQNGVDDSAAGLPGDAVTVTFTGTATRDMTMGFDVSYTDALGAAQAARGTMPIASGDTAAEIATAWTAELQSLMLDTDVVVTNPAAGQVLMSTVEIVVQVIDGCTILYANTGVSASVSGPMAAKKAVAKPKVGTKKKTPQQTAEDMA
jgi:hypothetical protein